METPKTYYEDEIDLREIIKTLLGYKWWVLGVTLLAAVATWVSIAYFLPKEYQTLVSITISPLDLSGDFDPDAHILVEAPGVDTMALIAQDRKIIDRLGQSFLDENTLQTMVNTRENDQIDFEVTGRYPNGVARFADVWVGEFMAVLGDEYGLEGAYTKLVSRVGSENLNWSNLQEALAGYSINGQADVLALRLEQAKDTLKRNLGTIDNHQGLIEDIQALDDQLAMKDQNAAFSAGVPLAMVAFQWVADEKSALAPEYFPEGYTIAQGRSDLNILLVTLQERSTEIELQISKDEAKIISLVAELGFVLSLQNAQIIEITNPADTPTVPTSPRPLTNTALAGAVGLMLSVGAVFVFEWWREPVGSDQ